MCLASILSMFMCGFLLIIINKIPNKNPYFIELIQKYVEYNIDCNQAAKFTFYIYGCMLNFIKFKSSGRFYEVAIIFGGLDNMPIYKMIYRMLNCSQLIRLIHSKKGRHFGIWHFRIVWTKWFVADRTFEENWIYTKSDHFLKQTQIVIRSIPFFYHAQSSSLKLLWSFNKYDLKSLVNLKFDNEKNKCSFFNFYW